METTAHPHSTSAAPDRAALPDWVKFGVPIVVLLLVGSVIRIAYELHHERENAIEMSAEPGPP